MDSREIAFSYVSDEQIVSFVQGGGCDDGTQILVKRYMPSIKLKAVKMAKYCLSADADDLFSDGLMGLLKAVRYYRPDKGAAFATFANLCIAHSMKTAVSRAIRNSPLSKEENFDWDLLEDNSVSTEDVIIDREQDFELYRRLSDILTAREFSVLTMYLRHFSYLQMAEELGISEKSVDNALQRAKAKLRHTLWK